VGRKTDEQIDIVYESKVIIGASLSEPHTSVTSLHTCVCMFACLLAWSDHLPKILNKRV